MAIFRQIQIEFWQDSFVLDLTPEEKYFYIYLLTNSKTRQCGIYELPTKIIETETGYNKETVEKLIKRFEEYGKIFYDFETKSIFIKNWIKYNKISNIKILKCIEKELKNVKSERLLNLFLNECKAQGYNLIEDINIPVGISQDKGSNTSENVNQDKESNLSSQNNNEKGNKTNSEAEKIKEFAKIYEENIGLLNGSSSQWLEEISQSVDINLFKKSIKIAKERGKCNKGYVNGIITNWQENKITTIKDLDIYEKKLKHRGEYSYGYNKNYQQSKYAKQLQNEDESIYQKPTREQIEYTRRLLSGL